MSDDIPRQIGPYKIDREIGRGGMGVVYLGHDPKLARLVAIKVLAADFAEDPERLARFEREARILASLSHGNIATVYGFEEMDGGRFLIMEFVEGETLADRLPDGPLPPTEALAVCAQIAAGVEAAHDAGVIHRDLKPGNVMVRPDGTAKVLDFGLARELPARSSRTDAAAAATAPASGVTREGASIGTPGYMSPEQVRGMTVDRRTDTFAFGCILFECLAGQLAFPGQTATDSIAAILEREPDWSALPKGTPPTIQLLLRRCLQKDRRRRLRDIGDARIEVEQAIDDPSSTSLGLAEFALRSTGRPRLSAGHIAIAGLVVVAAAAAAWLLKPIPAAPPAPVARLTVELGVPSARTRFSLAPDGTKLVVVAEPAAEKPDGVDRNTQLWLRRLDTFEPTPIPGTEGGSFPVFSPDSTRILFTAGRGARGGSQHRADLMVVGLDGRPPLTICTEAIDHFAPTWLSDDEVAYIHGDELQRVMRLSSRGGEPQLVADVDGPAIAITGMPGGEWIAVTVGRGRRSRTASISVLHAATGVVRPFIDAAAAPRFPSPDMMLFLRDGTLLATRVVRDGAGAPRVTDDLITILGGLSDSPFAGGTFDVSAAGHLALLPREDQERARDLTLATVDMEGNEKPFQAEARAYGSVDAFSPDGNRLAFSLVNEDDVWEVWIMELDTGAIRRRSATDTFSVGPHWLPDGRLIFSEIPGFEAMIPMITEMRRDAEPEPLFADGTGDESIEFAPGANDLTPDGRNLLFTGKRADRDDADVFIRPLDASSPVRPLIASRAEERGPQVSPDGRWLAFISDESGRREVYVIPLDLESPDSSEEGARVSKSGGSRHFWSAVGSRLFFRGDWRTPLRDTLYVVDIDPVSRKLIASEPREFLKLDDHRVEQGFAPMHDGERLLFVKKPETEDGEEDENASLSRNRIDIVLNWIEELEW